MIIVRTPLRISFVGGGTDFKDFYSKDKGCVLSAAINKYVYVIIKERFDDNIRVNYSTTETVCDVSDLQHELIRESIKRVGIYRGIRLNNIEIATMADIPSKGSGLGSSSSITVGTLHALYTYCRILVTAEQLAKEACQIEIDILGKPIGKQDQYIAAYGGINKFTFCDDEEVKVVPVRCLTDERIKTLDNNLLLFFTGLCRQSSTILEDQKANIEDQRTVLRQMAAQVSLLKSELDFGYSLDGVGVFLDMGWNLKKQLTGKITNPQLDAMYSLAKQNGAIGGKIAGAGGGGFLLLYCPVNRQEQLRKALKDLRELPFNFDMSGSKVIFNQQR